MINTDTQTGKKFQFDVIVIGSGIAGLSYCLECVRLNPTVKLALICKNNLTKSNSYYAQGGIAAVKDENDSFAEHQKDTLRAGDGQCNLDAVNEVINHGPKAIKFLQKHGILFDGDSANNPDLVKEGGHSKSRIFHVGDHSGKTIIDGLIEKVRQNKSIKIFTEFTAINLIEHNIGHFPKQLNEIIGLYILENKTKKIHSFIAKCIVLATGGAGKVYRYTSNPDSATGDGIAMAYRAGARVQGMEFYQFHPTLLYHPQKNNFLISEVVRGKGAHLYLPHTKERFLKQYVPKHMELATRDIIARALFTEIEKAQENFVWLDISHQPKELLLKHFPMIYHELSTLGIDMAKDPIPVVPGAHYLCGGILTNTAGETDLPRLFAIGETAFTGLHGANRLASNSLLEGVVMALNAAKKTKQWLNKPLADTRTIKPWCSESIIDYRRASQINAHWRGLRGEMTSYAGIVRTEDGLKDLLQLIHTRRTMIEDYYWKYSITQDLIELRNISLIAELIVKSALLRQESAGCHYREDSPQQKMYLLKKVIA